MPRKRPTSGRQSIRKRYPRRVPFWKNDSYMHAYEERIILRDIIAMTAGGNPEVSTTRLRMFAPMRYGPKLNKALARMAKANGELIRMWTTRSTGRDIYHLRVEARIKYDQEAA